MDEKSELSLDLGQTIRLALTSQMDDIRLYAARLVRKYRKIDPQLADKIEILLKERPQPQSFMRRSFGDQRSDDKLVGGMPIDNGSRLSLLRVYEPDLSVVPPFLSDDVQNALAQVIEERLNLKMLAEMGLQPSKSAVFVGQPGVGKTITAKWLASQLGVPLLVLDLTAVMSSLLGQSGHNIRLALDYAKSIPCVLLLDEFDAIAKSRGDDSDIGELKRLVTVILQEVDEWPAEGLLLAATNHPELIDRAVWRRFDLIIEFGLPEPAYIEGAVKRFLGSDYDRFLPYIDILTVGFLGQSFSDMERSIHRFRRSVALGSSHPEALVESFVRNRIADIDRAGKIELATQLANYSSLSQHAISDITGISRDTIRKYTQTNKRAKKGNKS